MHLKHRQLTMVHIGNQPVSMATFPSWTTTKSLRHRKNKHLAPHHNQHEKAVC